MKRKLIYLLALAVTPLVGCDTFSELSDAKEVAPIAVNVDLDIAVENLAAVKGLTVKFDNYDEALHYTKEISGESVNMDGILPGIYTVSVSGTALDSDNNEYYVNGNIVNAALFENGIGLDIKVKGLKVSPLVFKEIYFCGSRPAAGGVYFRDQFYEIYNNSGSVQYLDGVHFANLYPGTATTKLPIWPEEDGDNYAYGDRVWKFPGNGTDYPLEPGEAVVLAQEARNHFTNLSDSNDITIDNSSANWECWFGNASRDNPDVPNLPHIFYCDMNYGFQWLASVYGPALCIFRPDDGTVITDNFYEKPAKNPNCQVQEGDVDMVYFARIPANWIIDGIECMEDLSLLGLKRIPGFVDAGAATAGTIYQAKVVSRKVVDRRADGTPIYADTNNSTNDFETLSGPVIRRYGQKAPAWDGTNNN